MCAHIKAPSQTTLVANHRTKRDCSQQAFPVISYRKQQGGSAGSFVTQEEDTVQLQVGDKSQTHQQSSICLAGCLLLDPHAIHGLLQHADGKSFFCLF